MLLLDLPSEILAQILANCNLQSLYNAAQTCKRINSCINTDMVWRHKWKQLILVPGMQSLFAVPTGPLIYKDMCKRFYTIFGQEPVVTGQQCTKCHQVCCEVTCIQESEEMIIFDFGSKTTWFKYDSESTGQLSMHPTVAPLPVDNLAGLELSEEDLAATKSCPVCAKIIVKRRMTSIVGEVPASKSGSSSPKTERAAHGRSRISAAFSKLSLRSLQCFDSSNDYELDDMYLSGLRTGEHSTDSGPSRGLPGRGHKVESPKLGLHRGGACANLTPVVTKRDLHNGLLRLIKACTTIDEISKLETYTFLLRHMLNRNPFFQVKSIPFVICEPIGLDDYGKRCLTQYVIEELKVPGVCFIPKSIAASLYIANETCLVVDSGAHNTVVSPIIEQTVYTPGVQHTAVGGFQVTKRLMECLKMKGMDDAEIYETSVDSSQVKRECYLAYNPTMEAKRKLPNKSITVKVRLRNNQQQLIPVQLSHELYQSSEDMYLNLDLPGMIQASISSLDAAAQRKLLSNIVLTGGNCRLSGLSIRLTKDLQQSMPEFANVVHICDPRLMRGRTDAVIGASYVKKWDSAEWVSRKDYILHGLTPDSQSPGKCETRVFYSDDIY